MIAKEFKKHFKKKDNFSRNELYQFYRISEPNLNKNTFAWRIYNLKKKGVIVEIARGKYSFVDKKTYSLKLSDYSEKIALKISKAFPDIIFCISESNWINEFTNHQYSNNFTIVEVEKDFIESVFFNLKESYQNVYLKPTEIDFDRYISDLDSAVILIPFISRAPIKKIENKKYSIPTIEKLLVDIFSKTSPYFFLTDSEVKTIFENVFRRYNINQTTLFAYSERRGRKKEIKNFLITNDIPGILND
jgi:hypothetical protein